MEKKIKEKKKNLVDLEEFSEDLQFFYKKLNIIKTYKDGSIDVKGNVSLNNFGLKTIPFKFKKIIGEFDVSENKLENFINFPEQVVGSILINNNKFTSLEGCQSKIEGVFDCSYNLLENLEGGPVRVDYSYFCEGNPLTSYNGVAKNIGEDFITPLIEGIERKEIKQLAKIKGDVVFVRN